MVAVAARALEGSLYLTGLARGTLSWPNQKSAGAHGRQARTPWTRQGLAAAAAGDGERQRAQGAGAGDFATSVRLSIFRKSSYFWG